MFVHLTPKGEIYYTELVGSDASRLSGRALLEFNVLKVRWDAGDEPLTQENIVSIIRKQYFWEEDDGKSKKKKSYIDADIIKAIGNLVKNGYLYRTGRPLTRKQGYFEYVDIEEEDRKAKETKKHRPKSQEEPVYKVDIEGFDKPLFLTEAEMERLKNKQYMNIWLEGRRYCDEYVPAFPISKYHGMCLRYLHNNRKPCGVAWVNKQVCRTGENYAQRYGDREPTAVQAKRMSNPKIRRMELVDWEKQSLLEQNELSKRVFPESVEVVKVEGKKKVLDKEASLEAGRDVFVEEKDVYYTIKPEPEREM